MYIRTKDGVFELVDTYYMCVDGVETYMYDNNGRGVEIRGSQILKQSENLDELCDEFVGVDKTCENGHQLLRAIPYKCANFWNGGVYGAIWVDGKGLIYVAKMNDKGDLELI